MIISKGKLFFDSIFYKLNNLIVECLRQGDEEISHKIYK